MTDVNMADVNMADVQVSQAVLIIVYFWKGSCKGGEYLGNDGPLLLPALSLLHPRFHGDMVA